MKRKGGAPKYDLEDKDRVKKLICGQKVLEIIFMKTTTSEIDFHIKTGIRRLYAYEIIPHRFIKHY